SVSNRSVRLRHSLTHIADLEVDEQIFRARFTKGASMKNCKGACCRLGVDVDLAERDLILSHSERIRTMLRATSQKPSSDWFGAEFEDSDFPSGRAVSTTLAGGACIFLDANQRCVLHSLELQDPSVGPLKPFYCRAYPLCIRDGRLTI